MGSGKRVMTGKTLNREWSVGARHALYREDGMWYHKLKEFPGALFDRNGYLRFETEHQYLGCPGLDHSGQDLHVRCGIQNIPGYVRKR